MKSLRQHGYINSLLIPLILVVLFFIGAIAFGYWAYNSRQDYKNNVDQKITAAVTVAKQQESTAKDKEFIQKEKLPFRTYVGPAAYGSLHIKYPKTWSAYVNAAGNGSGGALVDGYFYPKVVPSINDTNQTFALRVQVLPQQYSEALSSFRSLAPTGVVSIKPYHLKKVPSAIGVVVSGQIAPTKQGTMVVLPLRNTTVEIWTEASQFEKDFNTKILPNFSFSP